MKTGAAILLALLAGCSSSRTLELPDLGTSELAFGALYDDSGRVVALGPVVTRQRLRAGGYTIESAASDLRARLFLVEVEALQAAADAGCSALESRAAQRACADQIASCTDDPLPCLSVLPAGDPCGDRLTLPRTLVFSAYENDKDDKLAEISDPQPLADTLVFCGPEIAPACPNVLPGWSVTENGAFRCVGPARQLGCSAEVDLSGCGFGRARGELDAIGALTGTVETPPCTIAALEGGDVVPGRRDGAFAIACGSRRFVATPMEVLFGEVGCARRGPAHYNEALSHVAAALRSRGVGTGRVTGLEPFRPPGWSPRYLVVGTGHDTCTWTGCGRSAMVECNEVCRKECVDFVSIPDCAGANAWHGCTGRDSVMECSDRCVGACNARDPSCLEDSIGHTLTIAAPEAPEDHTGLVDLDPLNGPEPGTSAESALVLLGDRATVAVASRRHVRVFRAQGPDAMLELDSASRDLGFDIAGIVPNPRSPEELIVYGQSAGFGAIGVLRLTGDAAPALVDVVAPAPATLPSFDMVAAGGPDDAWIFGASLNPPVGVTAPTVLEVITTDGSAAPAPVELGGRPTAVASLPGGAILAAVDGGGSNADRVLVLEADGGGVRVAATLPIAGDLEVAVALADASPCAAVCRVYLGYARRGANDESGRALVGLLEYDPADPSRSRIVPSYVETTAEGISILKQDAARTELIAVSSAQNRLTPIVLW